MLKLFRSVRAICMRERNNAGKSKIVVGIAHDLNYEFLLIFNTHSPKSIKMKTKSFKIQNKTKSNTRPPAKVAAAANATTTGMKSK